MKQFKKEEILSLANELQFSLSEHEIANIEKEFDVLMVQLSLMNEIDTSEVEPMVYPFDAPIAYFRNDEVNHVLSVEEALKNAPKQQDNFVVVPKVVK